MSTFRLAVLSFAALGAFGCDMGQRGRLVGFIVNGQTGERLNFFRQSGSKNNLGDDGNSKSQVYAVIDGTFRRAIPCFGGDSTNENAIEPDGCYQIDGIPEGMSFPLFAQAPDFEKFHTELEYPVLDEDNARHQLVGNIRMFPRNFTQDYRILITFVGQPLEAVRVVCQFRGASANSLQVDGSFLTPRNTGSATIVATTDAQGVALFTQDQLVNGATYTCESVVDQSIEGRVLSGQTSFVAGVTNPVLSLGLSSSGSPDTQLYAISSNVDNNRAAQGDGAQLIITLNRPAELVPATEDCQQVFLSTPDTDGDGNTGATVANITGNNTSETVNAAFSADGLTLTLSLRSLSRPFDPDDRGTSATFSGIAIRPRAAADRRVVRFLGSVAGCAQAQAYGTEQSLENIRTGGNQDNTVEIF